MCLKQTTERQGQKHSDQSEGIATIQSRDDGGLDHSGVSGGSKKRSDSGCIFKEKLKGFADIWDVGVQEKEKKS